MNLSSIHFGPSACMAPFAIVKHGWAVGATPDYNWKLLGVGASKRLYIKFPKQDNSFISISAFQNSDQKSLQVPRIWIKWYPSSHVFTPKRFASSDNFHYLFFSQTTKIQLIFKNFKNRPISKTNHEMRHFSPIFAHFSPIFAHFFAI